MDKNITTITNIETGLHAPAEIRQYNEKQTMAVVYREFESGHLRALEFVWKDDKWISSDGLYESDYYFDKTMNEVTNVVSHPRDE